MPAIQSPRRHDLVVLLSTAIALPLLLIWYGPRTNLTANHAILSGWIAALLLFAAIFIGLRARYRRAGTSLPRRTLVLTIALMLAAGVSLTLGVQATADQYDLTKLTFADTPLSSIHPPRKRLLVELLRSAAANSNQDTSAASSLRPIDPPLYSAASFASKPAMAATAASLQAAYNLDLAYADRQRQALASFDTQMQRVDPAYLQSWHQGRLPQEQLNAQLNTAEAQWVQSALSLYAFASAHSTEITYRNRTLLYAHPELRTELLTRVEASQALQRTALALRRKATAQQNVYRIAHGLPLAP